MIIIIATQLCVILPEKYQEIIQFPFAATMLKILSTTIQQDTH